MAVINPLLTRQPTNPDEPTKIPVPTKTPQVPTTLLNGSTPTPTPTPTPSPADPNPILLQKTPAEMAEAEAQATFEQEKVKAEQNLLKARVESESERQQALTNFFGAEYASNQKIQNFGWTGGALTDQQVRVSYLQSGINANLFSQEELMKAGYESEIAVARAYADLKKVELANQYYDEAVKNSIAMAELTGYMITPETQDMLNQYQYAKQIIDNPGNYTADEIDRANSVWTEVQTFAKTMFGEEYDETFMESFVSFNAAVKEFNKTMDKEMWDAGYDQFGNLRDTTDEDLAGDPTSYTGQGLLDAYAEGTLAIEPDVIYDSWNDIPQATRNELTQLVADNPNMTPDEILEWLGALEATPDPVDNPVSNLNDPNLNEDIIGGQTKSQEEMAAEAVANIPGLQETGDFFKSAASQYLILHSDEDGNIDEALKEVYRFASGGMSSAELNKFLEGIKGETPLDHISYASYIENIVGASGLIHDSSGKPWTLNKDGNTMTINKFGRLHKSRNEEQLEYIELATNLLGLEHVENNMSHTLTGFKNVELQYDVLTAAWALYQSGQVTSYSEMKEHPMLAWYFNNEEKTKRSEKDIILQDR